MRTISGCCQLLRCSARRSRAPPKSSRCRACSTEADGRVLLVGVALVLERDFDLAPIQLDLPLVKDHVHLHDLRHAELAQVLGGALNRDRRGLLPRLVASADQLDDFVRATGHWHSPSTREPATLKA